MMTIAQRLKIKEFPFIIKDSKGNEIYCENAMGRWYKEEFDSKGNKIYCINSEGYWYKKEFNSNNDEIYYENSSGFWSSKKFDSNGKEIYFENSEGYIFDNRPKQVTELSMDEIAAKFNIPVETLKIKK